MSTEQQGHAGPEIVATELSVAYVKYGGNAGNGQYFFAFSHPRLHVPHRKVVSPGTDGTSMTFRLGKHVPDNFVITGFVSTQSFGNLSPESAYYSVNEKLRGIEIINKAVQPGFFNIGIFVTDTNTREVIFCDPQVVNSPGEGSNG